MPAPLRFQCRQALVLSLPASSRHGQPPVHVTCPLTVFGVSGAVVVGDFFMSGPSAIQNSSPNQMLGTPSFVSRKELLLEVTSTSSRLDVATQQILHIGNMHGRSTNFIMIFYHVDTNLVHRLSQDQHNWARGEFNFC